MKDKLLIKAHNAHEMVVYQLTLGAHAHEGYGTLCVCVSAVC